MSLKNFILLFSIIFLYSKEFDYKILNFNKKKYFNLSLLTKNNKIKISICKNKTLYKLYNIDFINSKKCTIINNKFLICSFKNKKNFFIVLNFKNQDNYYSKIIHIIYDNVKNIEKKKELLNKINTYIFSTNYISFIDLINFNIFFVDNKNINKKLNKMLLINTKKNINLFQIISFKKNKNIIKIINFIKINSSFLNKFYILQINSLNERKNLIDIIKSNF